MGHLRIHGSRNVEPMLVRWHNIRPASAQHLALVGSLSKQGYVAPGRADVAGRLLEVGGFPARCSERTWLDPSRLTGAPRSNPRFNPGRHRLNVGPIQQTPARRWSGGVRRPDGPHPSHLSFTSSWQMLATSKYFPAGCLSRLHNNYMCRSIGIPSTRWRRRWRNVGGPRSRRGSTDVFAERERPFLMDWSRAVYRRMLFNKARRQ